MRRLCLVTLLLVAYLAVTSRADQPSPPLSVVSYNIRYANPHDGLDVWPNRVDAVVVEVETLNPKTQSGRFASDHLPVRATIRLQAAKTTPAE